eukprot:327620_1
MSDMSANQLESYTVSELKHLLSGKYISSTYDHDDEEWVEKGWSNVLPYYKWKKIYNKSYGGKGYNRYDGAPFYHCGFNLTNMLLRIHGYSKQMKESGYPYEYFGDWKWGQSGMDFWDNWLTKVFSRGGARTSWAWLKSIEMNWDYIDNTDFSRYSVITIIGRGTAAHYIAIIGVNDDKTEYLCTDYTKKIFRISYERLDEMRQYQLNGTGYAQASCYRVG